MLNLFDYELAKKIPLIKIKSSILKNIISNEIKINDEFLKLIEDKTICKGNTKIKLNYDYHSYENIINTNQQLKQLIPSKSKKDKMNTNVTTIDLGNCEYLLKKAYNISDSYMYQY